MAFCGPDWLRGARPISELRHLMLSELLEEFDAIRLWLVIIRNSVIQESQITKTVRGRKQLWTLLKEIDQGWTQVSKLFLSCNRSPEVRNALIDIHNAVTTSAALSRHSRLLPPPIFVQGDLIPPTMPCKPGKVSRFIGSVRNRLKMSIPRRRKVLTTAVTPGNTGDHSITNHKSLLAKLFDRIKNIRNDRNKVLPFHS